MTVKITKEDECYYARVAEDNCPYQIVGKGNSLEESQKDFIQNLNNMAEQKQKSCRYGGWVDSFFYEIPEFIIEDHLIETD